MIPSKFVGTAGAAPRLTVVVEFGRGLEEAQTVKRGRSRTINDDRRQAGASFSTDRLAASPIGEACQALIFSTT